MDGGGGAAGGRAFLGPGGGSVGGVGKKGTGRACNGARVTS